MSAPDPTESDAARWRWFLANATVTLNEEADLIVYAYLRPAIDEEVETISEITDPSAINDYVDEARRTL